jgi:hypothetical protein
LKALSGAMVTSERELRRRMITELVAGAAVVLALVLSLALRWAGWG